MRRNDPLGKRQCFFRSDKRIFHLNGDWYFSAREGDLGPFKSRGEAELEVRRFVVERYELNGFQHSRETDKRASRAAKQSR